MSPADLERFLDQWDAKLKILLGSDAAEAREWLGQYLSVLATGKRQEFLQRLGITDVGDLSAAQIEDTLNSIRAQRLMLQQQRSTFEAGRQQSVQMAQQFQSQDAQHCNNLAPDKLRIMERIKRASPHGSITTSPCRQLCRSSGEPNRRPVRYASAALQSNVRIPIAAAYTCMQPIQVSIGNVRHTLDSHVVRRDLHCRKSG